MEEVAFYKDKFVNIEEKVIPIQERGHQFGDGVYEVIRIYNGIPIFLKEHLARLKISAEAIELSLPYSLLEIERIIRKGLQLSQLKEAEVYFQVTRGISTRQHHYPNVPAIFSMTIRRARSIPDELRKNGIHVLVLEGERWANCYIKSLNLLPNIMAKEKAIAKGYDEAVFVKNGIMTEGSSSNLFVVKESILYTHPATRSILSGITREKIISFAKEKKLTVKEERFELGFFLEADEAFVTGTNVEILPIRKINDKPLPMERPICNILIEAYQKLIHK